MMTAQVSSHPDCQALETTHLSTIEPRRLTAVNLLRFLRMGSRTGSPTCGTAQAARSCQGR
jgi:hypothetical protein